ncbi:hybrid sensor histidine kinase/response regulator [Butyrivibrio sp. FC2001]|uniref:hybrid sensor histidine kinase/response regulator n=1 Tax=Butyrivibrio sp. FC2001 TaxID=1280671 RepID=UPI000408CF6B|nr:ATP-binding protein [Butyrivibrio sp. FC2001]
MRGEKKASKWTMPVTIALLFVVLIFAVNTIQDRFIYSDRVVQLTTYFSQLEAVISTRFTRYYKLLRSWSYHLEHEESSGIGDFNNYISTEKRIWDVEEAYLIDENGAYISVNGDTGQISGGEEFFSKLQKVGQRQVTHLPGKNDNRIDVFILSIKPGEHDGFNYCAIGLGLNSMQMKNRLTLDRAEMKGSQNYLVDRSGKLIVTSVKVSEEKENIVDYIKKKGHVLYDPLGEGFEFEIAERMTGVIVMEIEGIKYYITYMPCEMQNSMLICLTPAESVDASIAHVKKMNNMLLIVVFSIILVIIIMLMRYTAMQTMLEVANSANDTKTRFLANMSHDFRTPMNAMAGYITLMKENAGDAKKVREYGEKAEYAHRNMLNMINCVLDLSKMEEGGEEIIHERFSLNDLLKNVKQEITPLADEKYQKFTVSRSDVKEDALVGDPQKIELILKNLLQNAVLYTDENGEIALKVYTENADEISDRIQLRFEVSDNGIGIGSEFIDQIFEPFKREQRQRSSKTQSTGLGLTVVKRMTDMLGGTIDVESEVGSGTVFKLRLGFDIAEKTELEEMKELEAVLEEGKTEVEAADQGSPFEGMRFLAAEDNELNAEILVEILKLKGAELVDLTEDGEKAVAAFKEKDKGYYDMILMDIQMPVMDGYEAAHAIRSLANEGREDAKTIPIIAMSANAFRDDIEKTSESGMDAHLPKPIDINLFESTVRALKGREHEKL